MTDNPRRKFLGTALAAGGGLLLGGCDQLGQSKWFSGVLNSADPLTGKVQRALIPDALATEFSPADISKVFKANGSRNPQTPEYLAMVEDGFQSYRLTVGGLVDRPLALSLADLRAMPSRTQITRHDCVEGWSCIGKWKGVPLGHVLDQAGVQKSAKYLVFRCADSLDNDDTRYYESILISDARHPQSILAYDMNDATLGIPHGAPLRVRLERKLGYKMAKYISAIELVDSYQGIDGGAGGYWEDRGYQWHGGI
ncbi:MAG: molybdopterin-dependent oxidoreductase [Lysobacteraceae bacterium]